ncbi:3-deoxy-7-phosphoheptulonate synthase [bacterium]|nr:3-deoxy-7-phosphoheptulonate synthase [bacterium]
MTRNKILQNKEETYYINDIKVGHDFLLIAGPCSIEGYAMASETIQAIIDSGATIFRGGSFKPRTSPYSFQGLQQEALEILKRIKQETKIPIVTEILDPRQINSNLDFVDIIQIGSRSMHNFPLLKEVGMIDKPVILKRGFQATIEEWVHSTEYIYKEGNEKIILCERGIRTFETYTRNTLDLSAVPIMKQLTGLPVIVDPTHATGKKNLILAMCKAAIAAGADGLMVEVHPNPPQALSDPDQQMNFEEFAFLMKELKPVIKFFR